MPLRMAIVKSTASGETFTVDVCQWNPITGEVLHTVDEMNRMAEEALKLGDIRSLEMHTRMLEAYDFKKYCSSDVWNRILGILDVIAGKVSADTLVRRWESEIEETAELEQERYKAYQQATKTCDICKADIQPYEYSLATLDGGFYCRECASSEVKDD